MYTVYPVSDWRIGAITYPQYTSSGRIHMVELEGIEPSSGKHSRHPRLRACPGQAPGSLCLVFPRLSSGLSRRQRSFPAVRARLLNLKAYSAHARLFRSGAIKPPGRSRPELPGTE